MDNITTNEIREKIKTQEEDLKTFAAEAQKQVNTRQQSIQQSNLDLQNLVKTYQQELDRRSGAIDQLKSLIGEPTGTPDKPAKKPSTKAASKG